MNQKCRKGTTNGVYGAAGGLFTAPFAECNMARAGTSGESGGSGAERGKGEKGPEGGENQLVK